MGQTTRVGKTATKIIKGNGTTSIKYHATEVVIFDNKKIILNSGGWDTVTTKTRMNQTSHQFNLGFGVFQKKYEWFVGFKGETIPFEDGMVLTR